MSLKSGFSSLI